ncbi:MAG TPA: protein translocase subunit SecF [Acidimicrobiales bacterium]|nr:protein translocase subunit SecF [Acidimicrobiales bacterium]
MDGRDEEDLENVDASDPEAFQAALGEELEEEFEEELEFAAELDQAEETGAKRPNVFLRLYRGETSFDFIGNRKWWIGISALVIVIGIVSLSARGLNEGIDFRGGQSWLVSSQTLTVSEATTVAKAAGVPSPTVVQLTNQLNGQKQIEVTADLVSGTAAEQQATLLKVQKALADAAHRPLSTVSVNQVGATWGSNVTNKAIQALIIFFVVVAAYISLRFEFKMAVAAIVAVFHDILVVVGIYSIFQFLVTPDTVVAVLTVLGYSLYDTVVVFDRIRDNSQGLGASGRLTYSDMVNLSMNQTLARSINTSMVAIIPVLSVLVIGSLFLGATTLQSFGLALVIGLTSGAYSSIFIASPLLAWMKEREPRYVTIRQRLEARGERSVALTPAMAAAMAGAAGGPGRGSSKARSAGGVIRPGASKGKGGRPDGTSAPTGTGAGGGTGSGSSGSRTSPGSTRPAGNRPPPRPRKGKGKGKRR